MNGTIAAAGKICDLVLRLTALDTGASRNPFLFGGRA